MTTGSTMPIVTMMDAGAIAAAAVHPGAPARAGDVATALMIAPLAGAAWSAFERLVPPLLERSVVLRQVAVIEIDQALALVGAEAYALFRCERDLGMAARADRAHVFRETFLRGRLE